MQDTDVPYKFSVSWAENAVAGYVTAPIPQSASGGAASQDVGFPPVTAQPVGSGGIPPDIADFNGAFAYLSLWARWQQAGAPVKYDATLATDIGGYPKGAVVTNATLTGYFWLSTADDNTSDPDAGGANWVGFSIYPTIVGAQARLTYVSGGSIALMPYNGNGIVINGLPRQIPSVGVSLTNAGLTAATTYYIYAYMSGATMTLEASTTGHTTTTNGTEVKGGDVTRAYVGLVYMGPGTPGIFGDNVAFRGVSSWFNPRMRSLLGADTALATTASMSFVELNVASRVTFACEAGAAVSLTVGGQASNDTPTNSATSAVGLDGTRVGEGGGGYSTAGGDATAQIGTFAGDPGAGGHYATPMGAVQNAGTGTFSVAISGTVWQ